MRIVWDNAGFEEIDRAVVDYISDLGDRVLHAAQAGCPVETGRLKESLRKDMDGKSAVISANTPYAVYVEEGAGPHVIEGHPWLSIDGGHPVHVVHHPGNEATHFLKNALYSAAG